MAKTRGRAPSRSHSVLLVVLSALGILLVFNFRKATVSMRHPATTVDGVYARAPEADSSNFFSSYNQGVRQNERCKLPWPPSFFILGVRKAGTTALQNLLQKHESICFTPGDKLSFFYRNYGQGEQYYRPHFDNCVAKCSSLRYLAEKSPDSGYFSTARVRPRIKEFSPSAKLVVMLRDPVERAYSHWWMELCKKNHKRRHLQRQNATVAADVIQMFLEERKHYLRESHYGKDIAAWLREFPSSQVLFIPSERFFAASLPWLSRVEAFLSIPTHNYTEEEVVETYHGSSTHCAGPPERGGLGFQRPQLSQAHYNIVAEDLKQDSVQVMELLGEEFSWSYKTENAVFVDYQQRVSIPLIPRNTTKRK